MKSKNLLWLLVIVMFCQCDETGTTNNNTNGGDTRLAVLGGGSVGADVVFGKKGRTDTLDVTRDNFAASCEAAATICESRMVESGPHNPTHATFFRNRDGLLTLTMNNAAVNESNPIMYNLLNDNKNNGIVTLAYNSSFDNSIAEALEISGGLPVTTTTPILVSPNPEDPGNPDMLMLSFFGTIRGNSPVIKFEACNDEGGNITACNLNLAATDPASDFLGYSTYAAATNKLTLYVSYKSLNMQGWLSQFGPNKTVFGLNTAYTVADASIAESMSVPVNTVIEPGSYPIVIVSPGKWISVSFDIVTP